MSDTRRKPSGEFEYPKGHTMGDLVIGNDTSRTVAGVPKPPTFGESAMAFILGAQHGYTGRRSAEATQLMQDQFLGQPEDDTGIRREYAPIEQRRAAELANAKADVNRVRDADPEAFKLGQELSEANVAAALSGAAGKFGKLARPVVEAALYGGWGAATGSAEGGIGAGKGALLNAGLSAAVSSLPVIGRVAGNWLKGTSGADVRLAQELLESAPVREVVDVTPKVYPALPAGNTPKLLGPGAPAPAPAPAASVPAVGSAATRSYESVAGAGMPVPPAPAGVSPRPITAPELHNVDLALARQRAAGPSVSLPESALERRTTIPAPRYPELATEEALAQRSLGAPKESYAKSLPQEYKSPDSPGGVEIIEQDFMLPVKKPNIVGEGKAAQRARAEAAKRKAEIKKYWEDNPPRSVRGGYED